MKIILSLIAIAGCYLVAFTEIKHKDTQVVSVPLEIVIKVPVEKVSMVDLEPIIDTTNKDTFVSSLNACVNYIYKDLPVSQHIPKEILIAQAALETGWGSSRFANQGNNLFGIRTFNKDSLEINSSLFVPIFMDEENYLLEITYLGIDKVKTEFGVVNCLVFKPMMQEGRVFQDGEKMKIWISDDDNHLLIKVETEIWAGTIKALISECKNIKHPISIIK